MGRVLCEFRTFMKIMLIGSGAPTGILSFIPLILSAHDHKPACNSNETYHAELKYLHRFSYVTFTIVGTVAQSV
jgi:hypothetical protein